MSKQYNKTENRSRRQRYLKRRKIVRKTKPAVKKAAAAAPAA
jgi:hypothetical protein